MEGGRFSCTPSNNLGYGFESMHGSEQRSSSLHLNAKTCREIAEKRAYFSPAAQLTSTKFPEYIPGNFPGIDQLNNTNFPALPTPSG